MPNDPKRPERLDDDDLDSAAGGAVRDTYAEEMASTPVLPPGSDLSRPEGYDIGIAMPGGHSPVTPYGVEFGGGTDEEKS